MVRMGRHLIRPAATFSPSDAEKLWITLDYSGFGQKRALAQVGGPPAPKKTSIRQDPIFHWVLCLFFRQKKGQEPLGAVRERQKVRFPLPRRTLENTHLKVNRLTTRINIEDFEQSQG